jgi:hypothetical protein
VRVELTEDWMREQIQCPQALFSVSEIVALSGIEPQRLRRFLIRRGIIETGKGRGVRGQSRLLESGVLIEKCPAFWRAVVSRVGATLRLKTT